MFVAAVVVDVNGKPVEPRKKVRRRKLTRVALHLGGWGVAAAPDRFVWRCDAWCRHHSAVAVRAFGVASRPNGRFGHGFPTHSTLVRRRTKRVQSVLQKGTCPLAIAGLVDVM